MTEPQEHTQGVEPRDADGGPRFSRVLDGARRRRRWVSHGCYLVATVAALLVAFAARFELQVPDVYVAALPVYLVGLILIRGAFVLGLRLMDGRWRYVGVNDVLRLGAASTLSSAVFFALFRGLPILPNIPLSVVLIEWAAFTLGVAGVWILYRAGVERFRSGSHRNGQGEGMEGEPDPRRVVVVGAGDAGNLLARELQRAANGRRLVAFLDDDPLLHGSRVQGVPVLGASGDARTVVETLGVDELIVAIPSAEPPVLRGVVERLGEAEVELHVLPGMLEADEGEIAMGQLRPLRLEDLLGREPVTLEIPELREYVQGRTILVTGAAGSIGSELARQIAANGPARLVLLDQAESDLYFVDLELRERWPQVEVVPVVADVLDFRRLEGICSAETPHAVFHAAAYKHVPLMEQNPQEAIRTNVVGSWNVARLAGECLDTERFVLISTDKAADPASIMGASKRAAELLVEEMQEAFPETHYTAVRFGNVLGSNGSVVPLFRKQIADGGPVTVTHPQVTRYFMTIPEAVRLVLRAGLLEEARGRIAMLEMGEPVRILELARNLIRLEGKRPERDVEIAFTGLRPGEKLHEQLVGSDEAVEPTRLEGVRLLNARNGTRPQGRPASELALAIARAERDPDRLKDFLEELVGEIGNGGPSGTEPIGEETADAGAHGLR